MGGREVSRPYRIWFFAEGDRFLSFWRCHRPRWRGRRWWYGVADSSLCLKCHSTNDRCEALASPKGCVLCFCFSPPVFIHRTEGRSWYQPILHNHNLPSPRLNPTPYPYHQATLNRSATFACMVFRIMRHLRWLWVKISFLVGFYIYFAQIGAFSRKIIIFAKERLSISLKY